MALAITSEGSRMAISLNPWRHYSPMRRREARAGLLFVLPWLLGLLIFTAYPVLASIFYSFTDYTATQAPNFVGLDNYRTMLFDDPTIWTAVRNSLYYALLSVPLGWSCRWPWPSCSTPVPRASACTGHSSTCPRWCRPSPAPLFSWSCSSRATA
jgi:ABC-type Fe3+ transport system permease subunit